MAASAARGSDEQVAAAGLAGRAQTRLSVLTGASAAQHDRFGRSAHGAEQELSRFGRGAAAGTGLVTGLGRSLAFASGGFLLFAGASGFIRSSIDASREAGVAQRQLATQIATSGQAWGAYRDQIDQTDLKLSALSGFTTTQLEQSLQFLDRATGNVNTALQLNSVAADVARGRNIGLAQAAIALGKAYDGHSTALLRLGIQIPKGVSGMEALNIVEAKFAGQARAGSTEAERFAAVLHDSEVIIGGALLPTINQYLASGAKWLEQMNQTGALQRDVANAGHLLSDSIKATVAVATPFVDLFKALATILGGDQHALEALGAAFIVFKGRAMLGLSGIATEEAAIGTSAAAATGEVVGLSGALASLAAIGPIAVTVAILYEEFRKPIHMDKTPQPGSGMSLIGRGVYQDKQGRYYVERGIGKGFGFQLISGKEAASQFGALVPGINAPSTTGAASINRSAGFGTSGGRDQPGLPPLTTFTLPQKLATELAKANAGFGSVSTAQADITKFTLGLIHSGRLTGKGLEEAYNELASVNSKAAAGARSAAAAAKRAITNDQLLAQAKLDISQGNYTAGRRLLEADRARLEEELKQADTAELRLAITKQLTSVNTLLKSKSASFQVPQMLQVAMARADAIAALTSTQGPSGLQVRLATQLKTDAMKAINSHLLTMQGLIDAWREVQQANSVLSQTRGAIDTYHAVSTRALTQGLDLTRNARITLEERLAQSAAHRGFAPSGPAALGQPIVEVHLHGDLDQLVSKIEKKQRPAHQRAGARR